MREVLTTVLDVIGVAALAVGAAMIFRPAGLMLAGAALLAMSWRLSR